MQRKYWILGGMVTAGLAACIMPWPTHPGGGTLAGSVTLTDLDGDGLNETLRIETQGAGHLVAFLDATGGHFTHEVISTDAAWPLVKSGSWPRWRFDDANGRTIFDVRLIAEKGRPQQDMVVLTPDGGKRYRWVERGFMKMDAHTVVPGFSIGLVMLGDPPATLGMLGDRATITGPWKPLAPAGVTFTLTPGIDGRVAGVRYDTPELVATNGIATGASLADLQKHFPGHQTGDRWVAPNYGMTARLDAGGRAIGFDVVRPWDEERAARSRLKH